VFAELKNQIGLHRLRLRRLRFSRDQFFLAALAQNIKRLVRFLGQPTNALRPPGRAFSRTFDRNANSCTLTTILVGYMIPASLWGLFLAHRPFPVFPRHGFLRSPTR
jgi:peptidoglycan/xylan/chitin deacetylase (PgdA/CDA1 family)